MSKLKQINACREAQTWADEQESYEKAWNICERGDWMLWIAKRRNVDLRKLTKAKVECAKLVKHLMKDERSIRALEVADMFASGDATREELDTAYTAAATAATATAAYASYTAATAATAAAYAAADAAYAATAAAAAATATAVYASYTAATAARKNILTQAADICRKYIAFEDLDM